MLGQYSNQRSTHSAAPAGEADSTEVLWLPTASGPMPIAAQINGRLYAIDSDHLNTPRRLTNAQGQVVWQWLITGYGEVAPTTGATGYAFEAPQLGGSSNTSGTVYSEEVNFKLRYPGQVWDEETGLSYNLNRYYDAQAGRYVQSDPIGLEGGWNRFGYVGGNPLNGIDPDGLNPFAVANFVTNIAMRGYGAAQTALYRYAPALTELVAGASGVNGAVVSPISPLVAQIPTAVSRMTPVARAVAEGIESGGFCSANGGRVLEYADRIRPRVIADPGGHNFPFSFDEAILATQPVIVRGGGDGHALRGFKNDSDVIYNIIVKNGEITHRDLVAVEKWAQRSKSFGWGQKVEEIPR